jgi:anti-sigma factor RsiW
LQAFALGNLSETAMDVLSEHLTSCQECSQMVAQLDSAADALVAQLAGIGKVKRRRTIIFRRRFRRPR